jgi:hypothetical protein
VGQVPQFAVELGAAVLGMLIIGLIVAYNTRQLTGNQDPEDLAPSATLQGYYLGQLLIGALGVLFVSGGFSTGRIRSTFAAVPKRVSVLWAQPVRSDFDRPVRNASRYNGLFLRQTAERQRSDAALNRRAINSRDQHDTAVSGPGSASLYATCSIDFTHILYFSHFSSALGLPKSESCDAFGLRKGTKGRV